MNRCVTCGKKEHPEQIDSIGRCSKCHEAESEPNPEYAHYAPRAHVKANPLELGAKGSFGDYITNNGGVIPGD